MKNMQYNPYLWPNCRNFRVLEEIGIEEHDGVASDFRPEVEIWPYRACAMHPAIIIGTVRSLWMWLWGRYHIPPSLEQSATEYCTCYFGHIVQEMSRQLYNGHSRLRISSPSNVKLKLS